MPDDPAANAMAAEKVARTAGRWIDASRELGRFFERIFGVALYELGGALADKARDWRSIYLQARVAACGICFRSVEYFRCTGEFSSNGSLSPNSLPISRIAGIPSWPSRRMQVRA